jgi:predicted DNA-binding transcriptional regulator AlpA
MYRFKDINALTGLSRHQVRDMYRRGEFPRPFNINGKMCIGWAQSAVNKWLRSHS